MQMAVMQLAAKYPKLFGLSDMLGLRANQLTKSHLRRVADALEVEVPFNDEIVHAFVELLRGKDINAVSDLIQSPESVGELITFLKGGYRGLVEAKSEQTGFTVEADAFFIN